jgi:hypothetical protein
VKKLFFILFLSTTAVAANTKLPNDARPSKKLDFEDGVVEGLNKRPLDQFQQLSEADRNRKLPHLYRKRTSFREETAETLKHARYSQ